MKMRESFKLLVFTGLAVLVLSGCPRKSPVPDADVSLLEAERAIAMAQSEIDEARDVGADVEEPEEMLDEAREMLDDEDYYGAKNKADEAGALARSRKERILAELRRKEDAAAAIESAEELIREAEELGGDVSEPEEKLEEAKEYFDAEDYELSVNRADEAASLARRIIDRLRADTYIVGTWEEDRDCLWNIAAQRRIYNDPWKWKRIYRANDDKITDPDLIYPGQELVIPRN